MKSKIVPATFGISLLVSLILLLFIIYGTNKKCNSYRQELVGSHTFNMPKYKWVEFPNKPPLGSCKPTKDNFIKPGLYCIPSGKCGWNEHVSTDVQMPNADIISSKQEALKKCCGNIMQI